MSVEISKNFDLKAEARRLETTISTIAGKLLSDAVAVMLLRIRSGRDVNNAMMKAYSKEYTKRKADSGRSVSPPDITWSGLTLASIQSRVESLGSGSASGIIYFGNPMAADRARGNIAAGRDFYGLSEAEKTGIQDKFNQIIKETL